MLLVDQQNALALQMLTDLISLHELALAPGLVPQRDQPENLLLLESLPFALRGVDEVEGGVNLFEVELFGHFVAVLLELVLAVDDAFALFLVQFEVVFFVVCAYFEEQLFALLAEAVQDGAIFAAEAEIQHLVALLVVRSLEEAASLPSQSQLSHRIIKRPKNLILLQHFCEYLLHVCPLRTDYPLR